MFKAAALGSLLVGRRGGKSLHGVENNHSYLYPRIHAINKLHCMRTLVDEKLHRK